VAHVYNLSYTGGGDWDNGSQSQLGKIVNKMPPQTISQVWWCMPVISAMWEAKVIVSGLTPGEKCEAETPSKK
jgi:hypothetical protein